MRDTELYRHLLGLETPWSVSRVELSATDARIDVWASGSRDWCLWAQGQGRDLVGGGPVRAEDDVGVHLQRERRGDVPEPLADDLGRHARGQGCGGVGTSDVMQSDPLSPSTPTFPARTT